MRQGLWALLILASVSQADEGERVFAQVKQSVVTISTFDEHHHPESEGSGVVLNEGQVVTNCHVVHDASSIAVHGADGDHVGVLHLKDVERDLCLLNVRGLRLPGVQLRVAADIRKGETVYAIGNPLGLGLSFSTGLVATSGVTEGAQVIITSAPISPGSSGGGLFDGKGRLVGVTSMSMTAAQALNIAFPADWLKELIRRGTPAGPELKPVAPDPDWKGQGETLRVKHQWSELLALSRNWLEVYPTSATASAYGGLALYNLHQLEQARKTLVAGLAHDPSHATSLGYLAMTQYALGEREEARKTLLEARRLHPSEAFYWHIEASWLAGEGRREEARPLAQKALSLESGNYDNWVLLGDIERGVGRYDESIRAYRVSLRLQPDNPVVVASLAQILTTRGDYARAADLLKNTALDKPGDVLNWLNLGGAQENLQHFSEAERAYRKALELDPTNARGWHALSRCLDRTNRKPEAEQALLLATKYRPDFADAWASLGSLRLGIGDRTGARDALEHATIADPKSFNAWYGLALLLRELSEFQGSIEAMQRAIAIRPNDPNALGIQGATQAHIGQRAAAIANLTAAEKLDPRNIHALRGLAVYYGTGKEYEKSIAYSERAIEIDSANAVSWNDKGYSLLLLKRYADAEQAFETAIRLRPDFSSAWTNLGHAFVAHAQLGKAINTLEKALELVPGAPDARFYLAQAYAGANQPGRAKEILDTLVKQSPDFPGGWYMLTAVALSQNNAQEALASYTRLKSLNPAMASELRERSRLRGLKTASELPE